MVLLIRHIVETTADAAPIDQGQFFAQHIDDLDVQHIGQGTHAQALLGRVGGGARESDRHQRLGLGAGAYFFLDHASHRADTQVDILGRQVAHRQAGQVSRQQGLHDLGLEAAHQDEGEAFGTGKAFLIDGLDAVELQALKVFWLGRQQDARVIVEKCGLQCVVEDGLRVHQRILGGITVAAHKRLEQVRIAAHSAKLQVHELQQRFQISVAAMAADPLFFRLLVDIEAQHLAGQHLLQFQRRKIGQAHGAHHRAGVSGVVLVRLRIERLPAKAASANQDLVVLEVGRLQDHLDAVGQLQLGEVQSLIAALRHDAARLGRLAHQAGGQHLLDFGDHGGLLRQLHRSQQLLALGRIGSGVFRARINHQFGGLLRDHAAGEGIDLFQADAGEHLTGISQLIGNAGNGLFHQKVADVFGGVTVRAGFAELGNALFVTTQQDGLGALQFSGAKTKLARPLVFL